MASLFRSGLYGAINTADNTKNGFFVIQFISEAYTPQKNITVDGQVISASEIFSNAQYIFSIQGNSNRYCKKQPLQHTIIFPTRTVLHPCLYVIIIIYEQDIPNNLFSRNQAIKSIQKHPIIMTDADYDYILDEI